MGTYDSVSFVCPNCGGSFTETTRKGNGTFEVIDNKEVDSEIALELVGKIAYCAICGSEYEIQSDPELPKKVELKLKKFQPPKNLK